MSRLYDVLLIAAVIVALPVLAVVVVVHPRLRRGFVERLRPLPAADAPTLWLHAASVGEVEAAAPLVRALDAAGIPVVATTQTTTGRERLRALLPDLAVRLAPLDLPGLARVGRARVRVRVQVETELWPVAMRAVRRAGGQIAIVSARLSDTSFPRYARFDFFFRPLLDRVAAVGARSDVDAERFAALGVPPERIATTGDLKLDRAAPSVSEDLRAGIGPGPLLVAGSTHVGEDEQLLEAWARLREKGLRLVLVPRHPERAAAVRRLVERTGATCALRSDLAGATAPEAVVVDTIGELAALYALADLVFVGGSLVPTGGHNLLEPVRAGRVVVHGPHLHNQRAQEALLAPLGVLHRVDDAAALGECLERLLADPDRDAPAVRAGEVLAAHRGSVARTAALVHEVWDRA